VDTIGRPLAASGPAFDTRLPTHLATWSAEGGPRRRRRSSPTRRVRPARRLPAARRRRPPRRRQRDFACKAMRLLGSLGCDLNIACVPALSPLSGHASAPPGISVPAAAGAGRRSASRQDGPPAHPSPAAPQPDRGGLRGAGGRVAAAHAHNGPLWDADSGENGSTISHRPSGTSSRPRVSSDRQDQRFPHLRSQSTRKPFRGVQGPAAACSDDHDARDMNSGLDGRAALFSAPWPITSGCR
jgi:hypothetical protein